MPWQTLPLRLWGALAAGSYFSERRVCWKFVFSAPGVRSRNESHYDCSRKVKKKSSTWTSPTKNHPTRGPWKHTIKDPKTNSLLSWKLTYPLKNDGWKMIFFYWDMFFFFGRVWFGNSWISVSQDPERATKTTWKKTQIRWLNHVDFL